MLCPWFLGGLGNSFLPWFWIYLRCKTRKGAQTMADKKNLCAQIDIALHNRVTEEKDRLEMTTSQYIASLLTEYYKMKDENGGINMTPRQRSCWRICPLTWTWSAGRGRDRLQTGGQGQLLLGREVPGDRLGLPLGPAHQGMGRRQLDYRNLPALRARLQWICRLGIL